MFRYCIQIKILTSSVRIRNSVCTCLDGFKAGSKLVRFPAWVLCFGVTCSARAPSVALVWRLETAAWRHRESSPPQSLNSWLRYGFGTVLDPLRWLVSSWESSGPASRSALRAFERAVTSSWAPESCKREEKSSRTRLVFSTVRFGRRPPAADRIRLSVWGGAPPMSMVFWGHAHSSSDI